MDEKHSGLSLKAPAPSGGSLYLPGRGAFPAVDDHLVEPEVTRDEIIAGRRVVASPAEVPHGDKQVDLDSLLRSHVAPGYVVSADLITRFAVDSDFASDTCVRREGLDPATGRRYLEEVAFEVVSTQSERNATVKAGVMCRRGVRRIFGIWVKGRRRVCEWSAESAAWRLLEAESHLEDPCLAAPLPVKALLDAALVDNAVAEALIAKRNPAILSLEAAAEAKGEARGVARSIFRILNARGIAVSPAQREEILGCADLERLDRWLLQASTAISAEEITSIA